MATTRTQNPYVRTKTGHSSPRDDDARTGPPLDDDDARPGPPPDDYGDQNPCTTTTTTTPVWGHCASTNSIRIFYFLLNSRYSTTRSQCPRTNTTTRPQSHRAMSTTRAQSPCTTTTTTWEHPSPLTHMLTSTTTHRATARPWPDPLSDDDHDDYGHCKIYLGFAEQSRDPLKVRSIRGPSNRQDL